MRILIMALLAVSVSFAKVSVSVSIIPQAFFVQKIAGNLAKVNIMVQKGKSPETYEPSIKELEKLSKSQIYFTIGMPFENAWQKRFEGVNPALKVVSPLKKDEFEAYLAEYGDLADLHFHKDFDDLSGKSNESSHESSETKSKSNSDSRESSDNPHEIRGSILDEKLGYGRHEQGNKTDSLLTKRVASIPDLSLKDERESHIHRHYPHIWLSFKLSKAHAKVISDNLCEIDAPNCAIYKRNLARFEKEINKMFAHFKSVFGNKGGAFLVYHPAFSYIANELGLKEFAIEKDGKEAKIAHTKEILELIKKHNIKVIFTQPQFSSKNAQILAKEAKISLKTADPLAFDWLENMNLFLSQLAKTMGH